MNKTKVSITVPDNFKELILRYIRESVIKIFYFKYLLRKAMTLATFSAV